MGRQNHNWASKLTIPYLYSLVLSCGTGILARYSIFSGKNRDYSLAIKRLREYGVMINGSFVYGMNSDDTVFDRTIEWAITQGIETATFHILTPYPGTLLYDRMLVQNRITIHNWNLYDTRHAVYSPTQMSVETLEKGYWQSYRDFYRWSSIFKGAWTKDNLADRLRHLAYTGAWKKAEPIWDMLIRLKQVNHLLPTLESVLNSFGNHSSVEQSINHLSKSQLSHIST